ncbi:MAG: hypothetical protein BMS9Abin05_2488 [Rhodothermia bacterium]|nr:MAG: hypothetical protein BMS9Abin05_2488 [Rhodothermia bacterium]
MGKGLLIIVFGAILGASVLSFQQKQTALKTTERQTGYEEEVLAREIARSAYNIARKLAQAAGSDLATAVANINGRMKNGSPDYSGELTGIYQGGTYSAQAFTVDGQNVEIRATGWFGDAEHIINENFYVKMLTVRDSSKVTLEFLESMAGYCSAVFLQRFIPNNGGKPTMTGNFGKSGKSEKKGYAKGKMTLSDDEKYWILPPEMILNSGRNREGDELRVTPDDIVLSPGTRTNFFIGVDKDCSEQGVWEETYDESRYDYINNALEEDTQNMEDLQEGLYAMIEAHPTDTQKWRIAFEDLRTFSDKQHEDIKANGYGGSWDPVLETYGGSGWMEKDSNGYRKLRDFGWKPDFSDQVIQVSFNSCSGNCQN